MRPGDGDTAFRTSLTYGLAGVSLLALALLKAQSPTITVAPANPSILPGQTQQFTVSGIVAPAAIAGGGYHTCMVMTDQTIRCAGLNNWGQLGNGGFANSSTPVAVSGLTTAAAIGTGIEHTCALLADATVRCWGTNYVGQLGDGTIGGLSTVPKPVQGLTGVIAAAVGGFHNCAVLSDRTMRCWGRNQDGQVGNGDNTTDVGVPQVVSGLNGVVTASSGGYHSCALMADATVRCWGRNARGQLGDGSSSFFSSTPVLVSGITTAAAVSGGFYHTCALLGDGTVQCWGDNEFGQIGNTLVYSSVPITVAGISNAVAVSAGLFHSCALLSDGTTRCWGRNDNGQLGNGTTTNSSSPVEVSGLSGPVVVAAGGLHTCGLTTDRSGRCWGWNTYGQLGNGNTISSLTPVRVSGTGLTWTSSNAAVATIDATGRATGVGSGTATITATDGSGNSGSATLIVTEPVERVTLTAIQQGSGTGSLSSNPAGIVCGADCSESYDSGTTVTLTAAPDGGSLFTGWSGCDTVSGPTCTVTMDAARNVTASFAPTSVVSAPVLQWQYGGCLSGPDCQTGWYSSPAVADLDGDGQQDVIWGANDVVALNGANGSLKWRAPGSSRVWSGVAAADLTGDGTTEVIVGRDFDQLTVYDRFGSAIWTRNPFGSGELRTLAVSDLENDGQLDIVVGTAGWSSPYQLNAFRPDGSVRPGWPSRHNGDPGYGSGLWNANVAVADFQGDGLKEVFSTTGSHYITAVDRNGNQLGVNGTYAPRQVWSEVGVAVDDAAEVRGWVNCGVEHRPGFGASAPAIADIDADGVPELVVIGNVQNCGTSPSTDLYYLPFIFKLDRTRWSGSGFDWTTLPTPGPGSGPRSEDFNVIELLQPNAVVADLDGNGVKEILFPSYDGKLHAYWMDKTEHGNWPYTVPTSGASGDDFRFASEPVVADLNNDGRAEVIFTSWPKKATGRVGQLFILDSEGVELHRIDLPAPAIGKTWNGGLGAPTIANIDADPDYELIVGTVASGVVVYKLPNSANARLLWSTGRGNSRRTGVPGSN